MANKQGSVFKTINCGNKHFFLERKVDLRDKVKTSIKDITLSEWHLIPLNIAREYSREYSLERIVQIQEALLAYSD